VPFNSYGKKNNNNNYYVEGGDNQQSVMHQPECGACGVAKYQMTLDGLWSKETHPKDFPMCMYLISVLCQVCMHRDYPDANEL
jgi:hypothetical protein